MRIRSGSCFERITETPNIFGFYRIMTEGSNRLLSYHSKISRFLLRYRNFSCFRRCLPIGMLRTGNFVLTAYFSHEWPAESIIETGRDGTGRAAFVGCAKKSDLGRIKHLFSKFASGSDSDKRFGRSSWIAFCDQIQTFSSES